MRGTRADHGRGFGRVLEALASSIKGRNELSFIIDIASFQLAQKSNNLVMSCLAKSQKISALKIK